MVIDFSISNTIAQLEEDAKNLRRLLATESVNGNSTWVLTASNSTVSVDGYGTPTIKAVLYCDRYTREGAMTTLLFVASRCGAILQTQKLQHALIERMAQNDDALRTLLALRDTNKETS